MRKRSLDAAYRPQADLSTLTLESSHVCSLSQNTVLYICAVYSADVINGHKASTTAAPERSDVTLLSQNSQPASASPDSRAVIILVPVRLGGEKTNPDYFNLVKVRHAQTLQSLKHLYVNPPHPFLYLERSESGLLHRHHWREAQTGLLLGWISRLV